MAQGPEGSSNSAPMCRDALVRTWPGFCNHQRAVVGRLLISTPGYQQPRTGMIPLMEPEPGGADETRLTAEEYDAVCTAVAAGAGHWAGGQECTLNNLLGRWRGVAAELECGQPKPAQPRRANTHYVLKRTDLDLSGQYQPANLRPVPTPILRSSHTVR